MQSAKIVASGVVKVSTDPEGWGPLSVKLGPKTYRILKCFVSSIGLYAFLLTEGSIPVPFMRSGNNFANNYKGQQLPSRLAPDL